MIELFFDGGCSKNPGGIGSYGYVIKNLNAAYIKGKGIVDSGKASTNNEAEYTALLRGLQELNRLDSLNRPLVVFGDSQLVINMVSKRWGYKNGEWNPHSDSPHLKKLLLEVLEEIDEREVKFKWIPRESNRECDALASSALAEFRNVKFDEPEPVVKEKMKFTGSGGNIMIGIKNTVLDYLSVTEDMLDGGFARDEDGNRIFQCVFSYQGHDYSLLLTRNEK